MLPRLNLDFIMTKSTLTITNPSRSGLALEGDEGFETATILASTSQLGITAMGAFPLSLIALGQNSRWHFDDTLTLRPKRTTNAIFDDSQKMERAVEQFATAGLDNSLYDESTTAADHGQVGEIRPAVS
jgi:hypothetical protein